jgi:dsDNA-binding SOS-regulon protein
MAGRRTGPFDLDGVGGMRAIRGRGGGSLNAERGTAMAVEVRYHVIRDGKEVAMYATKKEADEHDKTLNISEALFEFIREADVIELEEDQLEELTFFLAKNRIQTLSLLKGTKPSPPSPKPDGKSNDKKVKKLATAKDAA